MVVGEQEAQGNCKVILVIMANSDLSTRAFSLVVFCRRHGKHCVETKFLLAAVNRRFRNLSVVCFNFKAIHLKLTDTNFPHCVATSNLIQISKVLGL